MLRNLVRVVKTRSHELRPRRKNLKRFGAGGVGVKKSNVDTYAV